MRQAVSPPGWPREVAPPGLESWEESAAAWLLDICPPEYRTYPVIRRHLVVLARFAVTHTEASSEAAGRALGECRTSLRDYLSPEAVEDAVLAWEREIARLVAQRRAAGLVEDALRGRRFRARL